MKKIKTAILGCTGLVGQQFARLLDGHPYFELACLTASSRSAGKFYGDTLSELPATWVGAGTRSEMIRSTTPEDIITSGARVVFSALPAACADGLETELRRQGMFVFSNASSHRMDPDVPLLIPEVNPDHLALAERQLEKFPGFIVTNSNCSVAGLALALKPLTVFPLRAVTVTTFQAISGGGRRGVASWDILGNVIPFISQEEGKVEREAKKLLGTLAADGVRDLDAEIFPSCSRVPVKDGHLQSVSVEFAAPVSGVEIARAMAAFRTETQRLALPTAPQRPIIVHDGFDRPQPALDVNAGEPARAAGMAVTVGRLRIRGRRCDFFLLVHNTVRGAAGGSVLNAELAFAKKLLPGG